MKSIKTFFPLLSLVLMGGVAYFLYLHLKDIDWQEVKETIHLINSQTLFVAFILSLLNYAILTSFDFLAFRSLKLKSLSPMKIMSSAFICYAFNLNLGAWVGGLAMRYRLYSGWNVPQQKIPLVMFFSIVTNWLGYTAIMTVLLFFWGPQLTKDLSVPFFMIILLGILGLSLIGGYFYSCYRKLKFKNFEFPSLKVAWIQVCLASFQWIVLSGIIYLFLKFFKLPVGFMKILFTYLVAGIAGVITHVPGGLGVLETTFLEMNEGLSRSSLLVALLGFRVMYYLLPLMVALPLYLFTEAYQKKIKH